MQATRLTLRSFQASLIGLLALWLSLLTVWSCCTGPAARAAQARKPKPPMHRAASTGQRALFAWSLWRLQVVDESGNLIAAYTSHNVNRLALSPQGNRVVYYDSGAHEVRVCDLGGINNRLLWKPTKDDPHFAPRVLSWSPDGRRVAFRDDGQLVVVFTERTGQEAEGKALLIPVRGAGQSYDLLDWSLSGAAVALTTTVDQPAAGRWERVRHAAAIVGIPGGSVQIVGGPELGHCAMPRWSPDGKRLAFVSDARRAIVIVDLASGSTTQATRPEHEVGPFAWSPDGGRIAFVGSIRGQVEIQVFVGPTDGARWWPVIRNVEHLYSEGAPPVWSPDGTKVAYVARGGEEGNRVVIGRADGSSAFRTQSDGVPFLWRAQWQKPPLSNYAREKDLPFADILLARPTASRARKEAPLVVTTRTTPESSRVNMVKGMKPVRHYSPVADGTLRAFATAVHANNRQAAGQYLMSFDDLQKFGARHPRLVGEGLFHWLYGEKRTVSELLAEYWEQIRSSWGVKQRPLNQIGPAYYCSEDILDAVPWTPYMFEGTREEIARRAAELGLHIGSVPRDCVAFVVVPHHSQSVAIPMLRVPGDGWKTLDW